jgi:hypothetical protein
MDLDAIWITISWETVDRRVCEWTGDVEYMGNLDRIVRAFPTEYFTANVRVSRSGIKVAYLTKKNSVN